MQLDVFLKIPAPQFRLLKDGIRPLGWILYGKSCRCDCIGRAAERCPLVGAIPLPPNTGTLGCLISPLARFAPPKTAWSRRIHPPNPCRCQAQRGRLLNMANSPAEPPTSSQPLQHAPQTQGYRSTPHSQREARIFLKIYSLLVGNLIVEW